MTTFNQLGFKGRLDKPDGWYLPSTKTDTAVVLETKASKISLGAPQVKELLKNIRIMNAKYEHVVGILYNGESTRVFKNGEEYKEKGSEKLHNIAYYTALFNVDHIDKQRIYELTARINNCLHFEFGIRNLYHRMIFTACALVAKRYDALMVSGMDYSEFHNAILNCLNKELLRDKHQNQKLSLLADVFSEIRMNLNVNSEDEKEQEHVKDLISNFIDWVTEISDCLNSDAWRGEDVMGIFFNEFNRYKKKSESGQVFTPEHITDFIYRILEVNQDDRVLDAACGSGGFLVKAMANMIDEAGGVNTEKAREIKQNQLFGIEFDREIYALACANMLIHKDGKTNLEQLDARSEEAGKWIGRQNITKVLMNPRMRRSTVAWTSLRTCWTASHRIRPARSSFRIKTREDRQKQMARIFEHHRLRKVVKLPEDLFFGIGMTTSIFVFETGVPQSGHEFFTCWMKDDGLETVKNKGRHDVHDRWPEIERYWIDVVSKQSGDDTCVWESPDECLSYQVPVKPFEISEEDFRKTAMDYLMYKKGIDAKAFSGQLFDRIMYSATIDGDEDNVIISLRKR